jgi:threonine synthase
MRALARQEGLYAEPTGASPVAALPVLLRAGLLPPGSRVVCLITGHGFKDGQAYAKIPVRSHRVDEPTDIDAVVRICEDAIRIGHENGFGT